VDRVLKADPDLNLPGVNADLAQVIAKLLSKTPDERYQHASEVQAALHTAMGQPVPSETNLIRESFLQAATFVGRKEELEQLNAAIIQTQAGQSPVLLIGGESGVGKTRLMDEVRIQAMLQGLTILRGQGVEGGGLPYQLWRAPVRRLLLMHSDIPDLQAGILKDLVPDISGLLDREVVDAPKLEDHAYQQRLILAIVDLFRNLREPVLLLLEDLQWTGESLAVLQQMIKVIEQLPRVMVLGNYRDEERPDLPDELPESQSFILERLDDAEVARLSQAMLGEAASSLHIVSLLTQETEGNTFFIVEVMRALAEEAGQLDDISTMTLPEGVFTGGMARLLQRRIQKVATSDQALLQLAAVAGRQLDVAALSVLSPNTNIPAWQQRVGDAAVLTVRDNQWEFVHDKLRETLLAKLAREVQQELHRRVAEALETVYPEDSNYNEALLAHWHEAEDLDKEIHYLSPVVQHLITITGDYEQARVWLRRGLELLPKADGRRIPLLNERSESYWRQGQYAEGEAAAQLACSLAQQVENQAGLARSLTHLGIVARRQVDYTQARDYLQRSLAIWKTIGDQQGIATSLSNLGIISANQGECAAARDYFQQSLAIQQAIGNQLDIAYSLNNLGEIARTEGEYTTARDYSQQSLDIKQAIGDQRGIANSLNNLGLIVASQGEYAAARDYFQQSLAIQQAIGDQLGITNSLINLGDIARNHGDYAIARDYCQQSLAIGQAIGDQPAIALSLVNLGLVAYHQGDYAQARNYHQQSFSIYREIDNQQGIALTLSDLGYAAFRQGDSAQACDYLQQSLSIAPTIPLLLMSLPGFAWLYLQGSDPIRCGELCGLAQHHPASDSNTQQRLYEVLPQLEVALPPTKLQAALERGKTLDLDTVVAELLAGFGEDNA